MTGELYLTEQYWCSFGTTLQAPTVATLEEISESVSVYKTCTAESILGISTPMREKRSHHFKHFTA